MASLPPRPDSPLRMPARDDRRHPPDDRDRDRMPDRRPMRPPPRFGDRPPPGDRLYTPSRPRPDSYVAPPYDRRRDFDRDRSRERRRDRSRDYERDRSPRRRSPDRDFRGYRGPPPRRRFSPPGRGGRPYRRDSRSPRRRISRSPPPYRGGPPSRPRSRSPFPASPRRSRFSNHPLARSSRSRSPYRRRPSIDRSQSPSKRPIERRHDSPKEPGEHDEEMPSPKPIMPEVARSEPPPPPPAPSIPDVAPPLKEEAMGSPIHMHHQDPVLMEERPPRQMSSPPPNDMDIIVASDGIQHPVSNERSSPITPPLQMKLDRMKAEAAAPSFSNSFNRRRSDSTARAPETPFKREADDQKPSIKPEPKYERSPYIPSPALDIKKAEDSAHGMDSPRAPTVASSQAHRSPSPRASPVAPSPAVSSPMIPSSRPLPTGPSRGWGGRSPPRGPRSHIQRATAAPMSSPIANPNSPHPFPPRGPRRGGFQSGPPYRDSSAPSHYGARKKNVCDPKSHEPAQSLEIDAEVAKLSQAYPKLQSASEASSRAVFRALQELDMANIDLSAAEGRRLMAEQQLEKAKSGLLGIDALSFPASPAS